MCGFGVGMVATSFALSSTDIDECTLDPCEQICNNTSGSFVCSCNPGYRLDDNGVNCDGMIKNPQSGNVE